jgi:hypothetical protein
LQKPGFEEMRHISANILNLPVHQDLEKKDLEHMVNKLAKALKLLSMNAIGGFFELELPQGGANYHSGAIGLSTGRACLGVFIAQVNPKKVLCSFLYL